MYEYAFARTDLDVNALLM